MFNIPDIVTDEQIDLFHKKVCNNIKRIRQEKKMSQLEVSLSIGQKSSGFYSNMENYRHKKHFNLTHLYKLSTLFNVPINKFLEFEN